MAGRPPWTTRIPETLIEGRSKFSLVNNGVRPWKDIPDEGWRGILIGNGASQAVWQGFRYSTLFEQARRNGTNEPLADAEQAIFHMASTVNFELVLGKLRDAEQLQSVQCRFQTDRMLRLIDIAVNEQPMFAAESFLQNQFY